MEIKAKSDSQACPFLFLEEVLMCFGADNDLSAEAVDTGSVRMRLQRFLSFLFQRETNEQN